MKRDMLEWKHVFKLDPDRALPEEHLRRICLSGTNAVMVGGSSGVTYDNTSSLLRAIRSCHSSLPCLLEVSDPEAVVPGFDYYLIPIVLNSQETEWIVGRHHQAVKQFSAFVEWDRVLAEGYVILNGRSTAAKVTSAQTSLGLEDIMAYAEMADKLLGLPIVYLEYSGEFGDMHWVRQAADRLENSRLFYGGGIDSLERARMASEAADTIVVGNIIYDHIERALETVGIASHITCLDRKVSYE